MKKLVVALKRRFFGYSYVRWYKRVSRGLRIANALTKEGVSDMLAIIWFSIDEVEQLNADMKKYLKSDNATMLRDSIERQAFAIKDAVHTIECAKDLIVYGRPNPIADNKQE